MIAIAPSIATERPSGVGLPVLAVATLRDLGMPLAEVDAILEADDARLVRRYLLLHAERLEERLADQLSLLMSFEPILAARVLAADPSGGGSRRGFPEPEPRGGE